MQSRESLGNFVPPKRKKNSSTGKNDTFEITVHIDDDNNSIYANNKSRKLCGSNKEKKQSHRRKNMTPK